MLKKFLLMLALMLAFTGCSSRRTEFGEMRVRVLDGLTDTPVRGAAITVPETGERLETDENGMTSYFSLPVIGDSEYDKLLENPDGRATLLVTKDGFTPYLLLYARVTAGCRRTCEILLFPDDGTLEVFTVIEAPSPEWARELASRYR